MNEQAIGQWLEGGNEVGSHTVTHPRLDRLDIDWARFEITESRRQLERVTGSPVKHFCYPYGDYNESIRDAVRDAGYATGCTTEFGVNTAKTNLWQVKRVTARYASRSLRGIKTRLKNLKAFGKRSLSLRNHQQP